MHTQLIELFHGALNNPDNHTRKQCQLALVNLREKNTVPFFETCTDLLVSENYDQFTRKAAATLLGRSLQTHLPNSNVIYWDALNPDLKQKIKNQLLGTLISKNPYILKFGAHAISYITAIQLPRGEWHDLISSLAENTYHKSVQIRIASIVTMGYICQQLKYNQTVIDDKLAQQFLAGIIMGLREQENQKIIQASHEALRDSIFFLKNILAYNSAARKQIFKLLFQRVSEFEDPEIVYQVLYEYSKSCYEHLAEYIQDLKLLTLAHIQERNGKSVYCIQLWETIGSQYLDRIQLNTGRIQNISINNYLIQVQEEILPQVMGCLLIENESDMDFPLLRQSAIKTISVFVASGNERIIDKVTEGVGQIIQSKLPGHRQATVLLFSTLSESKCTDYVRSYFDRGFSSMLKLITDQESIVAKNSLIGFITLAQFFPEVFYHHTDIKFIILKFLQIINSGESETVQSSLQILKFITEGLLNKSKNQNSILSTDPSILLQPMVTYFQIQLNNFQKEKEKDNREKAVIIIMNCLMKGKDRQVAIFLIEFLINKYYEICHINHVDSPIMIQSILAIMHTAILALQGTLTNLELLNKIYHLLKTHISKFGVESEGLNIISSLMIVYSNSLKDYLEEFFSYIMHGLQSFSNPKTTKASLHCIGDMGRIFKDYFYDREIQLMNKLLKMLHNQISRQLKIDILMTIADLLLGLGISSEMFVDEVIKIVDLTITAVYDFNENPNEKEYVDDLKKVIIELYACLTFALSNAKANRGLYNYYTNIATFVVRTCNFNANPKIDYIKSCLYLLFDSGAFLSTDLDFRDCICRVLKSNEIKDIVRNLQQLRDQEDTKEILQFVSSTEKSIVI